MHVHHIMPKHLGGSNDPENLVEVTVEEHAKIHHSQWILGGRWQDKVAWQALSSLIKSEEVQKEAARQWMMQNNPMKNPKNRKRMSERMKGNKRHLGHKHSEASIQNISKGRKGKGLGHTNTKGMKWFHNGIQSTLSNVCPKGYVPGRLYNKNSQKLVSVLTNLC